MLLGKRIEHPGDVTDDRHCLKRLLNVSLPDAVLARRYSSLTGNRSSLIVASRLLIQCPHLVNRVLDGTETCSAIAIRSADLAAQVKRALLSRLRVELPPVAIPILDMLPADILGGRVLFRIGILLGDRFHHLSIGIGQVLATPSRLVTQA